MSIIRIYPCSSRNKLRASCCNICEGSHFTLAGGSNLQEAGTVQLQGWTKVEDRDLSPAEGPTHAVVVLGAARRLRLQIPKPVLQTRS